MRIPVIHGIIDRRILVNYRVDPSVLAATLPAPFRPKIVHGVGLTGICLIRLERLRPTILPPWLGLSSENAAHRSAVVWDDHGTERAWRMLFESVEELDKVRNFIPMANEQNFDRLAALLSKLT